MPDYIITDIIAYQKEIVKKVMERKVQNKALQNIKTNFK